MPKSITPTEISHATDTTWTDVDVTSHVGDDAGSVAGVILRIVNADATENEWGVRKNGSTDSFVGDIEADGQTTVAVGVDSSDIFELYLEDASEMECWLVGYVTTAEGSFDTNKSEVGNAPADATWNDVDISTVTGGETAVAVFLILDNTYDSHTTWGLRENGSTDSIKVSNGAADLPTGHSIGGAISVDGSEIFEMVIEDTGSVSGDFAVYVSGWLTDNFTSFANSKDYSTATTGSYQDADTSGDVPADNTGIGYQIAAAYGLSWALRSNADSAFDEYHIPNWEKDMGWVAIDGNRIVEQKIESTSVDFYVWGYTSEPSAAAAGIASSRSLIGHGQGT